MLRTINMRGSSASTKDGMGDGTGSGLRLNRRRFLRTVGAHAAQGYLHLRPTSAADFECSLGQHNAGRPAGGSVTPLGPRRASPA